MKQIKLAKGFKTALAGSPDLSVIQIPDPKTVAVSTMDIPYIRPKLLVKENDRVKTGAPLFCDKRNPDIQYVSPGTGTVRHISFGERRRLKEVVIALDTPPEKSDDFVRFDALTKEALETTPRSDIAKQLRKGGLWQCFRQLPSRDTADDTHEPPMIIVSLNGNDLYAPHPQVVLNHEADCFVTGLTLLKLFSKKIVVTARHGSLPLLNNIHGHITHVVPDMYPAWEPAAVLYQLKKTPEENRSWYISAEHLILVAKFLLTGVYPVKRVITVTRDTDAKPHVIARQGSPVRHLAGSINDKSLITSGRFNGRSVDPDSHMGFFESTLNIIQDNPVEELFGFIQPGFSKPTVSRAFLSCLNPSPQLLDSNLHGEERACINCGYCANICPVDLLPSFIMKALLSDDIEDALALGLLDCCKCGLCAYTCPSKVELTQILSNGITAHYKDKE